MDISLHEFEPDTSSMEEGDYVQLHHRRVENGEVLGVTEFRPLDEDGTHYFFGSTAVQFRGGATQPIEVFVGEDLELDEAYEIFKERADKARAQAEKTIRQKASQSGPGAGSPGAQQSGQPTVRGDGQNEDDGSDDGDDGVLDFSDLQ